MGPRTARESVTIYGQYITIFGMGEVGGWVWAPYGKKSSCVLPPDFLRPPLSLSGRGEQTVRILQLGDASVDRCAHPRMMTVRPFVLVCSVHVLLVFDVDVVDFVSAPV